VTTIHPRIAAAASLAAALVACSSPPPKAPTVLAGSIQVSQQVNPNTSQRPSPLLLRVYELKAVAAFNGADFMSLYQRDQAELGGDFVAREEFVLAPGETRAFRKTLSPDTHFLGVVAAFRDLDRSTWRSVVAVDPNKNQQVVIKAAQLAVDASVTTPAAK
jgi:type VI secretion system protein VasD